MPYLCSKQEQLTPLSPSTCMYACVIPRDVFIFRYPNHVHKRQHQVKSRYKYFNMTANATRYFLFLSSSSQYTQLANTSSDCRKNSNANLFAFAMCKSCAKLEHKIKDAGIQQCSNSTACYKIPYAIKSETAVICREVAPTRLNIKHVVLPCH